MRAVAKKLKQSLKFAWKVGGLTADEPPEWVIKRMVDTLNNILYGGPEVADLQRYKDDWENQQKGLKKQVLTY